MKSAGSLDSRHHGRSSTDDVVTCRNDALHGRDVEDSLGGSAGNDAGDGGAGHDFCRTLESRSGREQYGTEPEQWPPGGPDGPAFDLLASAALRIEVPLSAPAFDPATLTIPYRPRLLDGLPAPDLRV